MHKCTIVMGLIVTSLMATMVSAATAVKPAPAIREPAYKSSKPLYLNLVLGDQKPMLAVIDESQGVVQGYDLVYLDLNRDQDLTNDSPIPLAGRQEEYPQAILRFTDPAPLNPSKQLMYEFWFYSLQDRANSKQVNLNNIHFSVSMQDNAKWSIVLISRKGRFYTNAADALAQPLHLSGKVSMTMDAAAGENNSANLALGIWDAASHIKLLAQRPDKEFVAPTVTLLDQDGRQLVKNMKFGFDWGHDCYATVRVTADKIHKAIIELDMGPTFGKLREEVLVKQAPKK